MSEWVSELCQYILYSVYQCPTVGWEVQLFLCVFGLLRLLLFSFVVLVYFGLLGHIRSIFEKGLWAFKKIDIAMLTNVHVLTPILHYERVIWNSLCLYIYMLVHNTGTWVVGRIILVFGTEDFVRLRLGPGGSEQSSSKIRDPSVFFIVIGRVGLSP
jgi:hypothetical protein